ncbi:hypothetical protein SAMN02745885_01675, partial [Carboxydocella sporoproducens DSM 16521]
YGMLILPKEVDYQQQKKPRRAGIKLAIFNGNTYDAVASKNSL